MKLPTLTRLPSHKKFKYTPRYYDPIKEEIDMKMALARKEMQGGQLSAKDVQSRISRSFRRTQTERKRSFLIQALIVVMLLTLIAVYFS
jgi:hypothetical protein